MAVVIFEGCDRCGKGTQIELLKKRLEREGKSVSVIHCDVVRAFDNTEKNKEVSKRRYIDLVRLMNQYTNDKNMYLLFDRSHIGEAVYSPLYRNYSGDYVFDFELLLQDPEKITSFFFIDTPENLISRDDGKSFSTDVELKRREIELFYEAYEKTKTHGVWVNIADYDIAAVEKIVNSTIK